MKKWIVLALLIGLVTYAYAEYSGGGAEDGGAHPVDVSSDVTGEIGDANVADNITVTNYLPLAGGTMTGRITLDTDGVRGTASDVNPTCSVGVYDIFADLSETRWKKCENGVVSDLDTTGSGNLGTNLSSTSNDILSNTGTIRLGGTGGTNNETLDLDCETTANECAVSTVTGVQTVDFETAGIALSAESFSSNCDPATTNCEVQIPKETANATIPPTDHCHLTVKGTDEFQFYCDGGERYIFHGLDTETVTIAEPDVMQGIEDIVALMHFPAESYPDGVNIKDIVISTSATCTDTVALLERSNNGTAWATDATVESITLSGTRTEDDGTLTDANLDADDWLAIDLDGTSPCDVGFMTVTVTFRSL